MKLQTAIKKVKKELNLEPEVNGIFYSFQYDGEVLQFLKNRDETIHCISTRHVNDLTDVQSDYFAETFWDNLTQALRSLKRS